MLDVSSSSEPAAGDFPGRSSPRSFMGQVLEDMSTIRALVGRTRTRMRLQAALEGATTAVILALAGGLPTVYALRAEWITSDTALVLLLACAGIVALGAALGAAGRLDEEQVARRLDRASNLADRLSTAVAFERTLRGPAEPDETHDLMHAAIRDAVRAAPRADVRAAAPFAVPRDGRPALIFAAVAALVAGLALPTPDHTPSLGSAEPPFGAPGAKIILHGKNLHGGLGSRPARVAAIDPIAAGCALAVAGADLPARPTAAAAPAEPDLTIYLGRAEGAVRVEVLDWQDDTITIRIPRDAQPGETEISGRLGSERLGPVHFTVVDPDDIRFHDPDSVAFTEDEKDYIEGIIAQLRRTAKDEVSPDLDRFADKMQQMMDQALKGKLTKEQLMEALQQAQDELAKGTEPEPAQVTKDLADTGKELAKNPVTHDLGKALEKGDLDKARQEMEKLADKIDQNKLSDKDKQAAAKAMEKAAKAFEQKQQQRDKQQQDQVQKAQDDIKQMQRRLHDTKDPREQADLERRLQQKKRELKQLQKQQQEQNDSHQRRALKRLHKDMDKAAKAMEQKAQNQQQQQQQNQQASRKLRDVARETGRVDADQRKMAAQKKAASQVEDLREALRRAKRRGNQGPKDPFGRNGKQSDFAKRAGGGQGNRKAWQKGRGLGQGQNGGKGQGKPQGPSHDWGNGHDPNLRGDPTAISGHDADKSETGVQGHGSSRRETILAAAQKGFASTQYKKVYTDYQKIVEEVMNSEKVPPAYKYYVKKYFNEIKPHPAAAPD
jgi:hypothetical protein